MCKYLRCLFCSFCTKPDVKKRHQKKAVQNKSPDTEELIRSSTMNSFDRWDDKTMHSDEENDKIRIKSRLRYISPSNSKEDNQESHRIRLAEQGFELVGTVGEGLFSKVFEIRQNSGISFAVKAMKNRELADSTSLFRRLAEEVELIKTEAINENLVRYHSVFIYDSLYSYVVMDLIPSRTLWDKLLETAQGFSESDSQFYFYQISLAINYLHGLSIAHRNLKLENVFVFEAPNGKQVLKVSDYCINRTALKSEKVVVYTRGAKNITYMSPQILKFYAKHLHKKYKKTDHRITPFDPLKGDIWALGVCLYYMLMKTTPYGLPPNTRDMDKDMASKTKLKFLKQCLIRFTDRLDLSIDKQISFECKELILKLLEPIVRRRIDSFAVNRSVWIRKAAQRMKT